MSTQRREWGHTATYLALVAALSGLADLILIAAGSGHSGFGYYTIFFMWTPALAAFLTCRARRLSFAELGWGWPAMPWLVRGALIPLGYAFVAYIVVWATGLGRFGEPTFVERMTDELGTGRLPDWLAFAVLVLFAGTIGVIRACSSALGEEIGWRGFLLPQLTRVMSPLGAALVTGVAWALYHLPLILGGDYNAGTPAWWGLPCFATMIMSVAIIAAWLRLASNSLWPAVLLHASHNVFLQVVLTPATADTGRTRWIVDEFGIAVPLTSLVVAGWVIATGRLARRQPLMLAIGG